MDARSAEKSLEWMFKVHAGDSGEKEFRLTIHGGEPLLAGYDVLATIVEMTSRRFGAGKARIALQSNLWHLDEAYAELFSKHGVAIGTSLDGPRDLNDLARGEGYFDRTMAGIELARAYGLDPAVIATVSRPTLERWRESLDFFRSERLRLTIHPSLGGGRNAELAINPEEWGLILDRTLDYYLANADRMRIDTIDSFVRAAAGAGTSICTYKGCAGLFAAVDPAGDVYHCQRFAGQPGQRLASIDEDPDFPSLMGRVSRHSLASFLEARKAPCEACEASPSCFAGCYHNALSYGRDSDPFCPAYRSFIARIRELLAERIGAGAGGSDPLLALVGREGHPAATAENAKRVLAAFLMGRDGRRAVEAMMATGAGDEAERVRTGIDNMRTRMTGAPPLNNLYLHATFRCQLDCSHCYNKKRGGRAKAAEMGLPGIERLLADEATRRFRQVVITGGEPLFHADAKGILSALRRERKKGAFPKTVLRSNFFRIPDCVTLEELADSFDSIIVSLDGGEAAHDARRGRGSFAKTRANMARYQESAASARGWAELSIAACLERGGDTSADQDDIRAIAGDLGVSRVRFNAVLPIGEARYLGRSAEAYNFIDPETALEKGFRPVKGCGLGTNLYVEPDGGAYPCYVINEERRRLGDALTEGLSAILESAEFDALRRHSVDDVPICRDCDYRYLCGGLCRAFRQGRVQGKDHWCGEKSEKAERLLRKAAARLEIDPEKVMSWR
jgi:uncharacterized protein